MINPYNIVKSRFIKGEDLPEWYEDRLKKCSVCRLNSANIKKEDKSLGRKAWELIADNHCTHQSCGCTIEHKAKLETESCPEGEWGAMKVVDSNKLNIVAYTDKAGFTYNEKSHRYTVDYGVIPWKFDSMITLIVLDEMDETLKIGTSCGCTAAEKKITDKGIEIKVKYDTNRIGKFGKNITLSYGPREKRKQTVINVVGEVKK